MNIYPCRPSMPICMELGLYGLTSDLSKNFTVPQDKFVIQMPLTIEYLSTSTLRLTTSIFIVIE